MPDSRPLENGSRSGPESNGSAGTNRRRVSLCEHGWGPFNCLMTVKEPPGADALEAHEVIFGGCTRVRQCMGISHDTASQQLIQEPTEDYGAEDSTDTKPFPAPPDVWSTEDDAPPSTAPSLFGCPGGKYSMFSRPSWRGPSGGGNLGSMMRCNPACEVPKQDDGLSPRFSEGHLGGTPTASSSSSSSKPARGGLLRPPTSGGRLNGSSAKLGKTRFAPGAHAVINEEEALSPQSYPGDAEHAAAAAVSGEHSGLLNFGRMSSNVSDISPAEQEGLLPRSLSDVLQTPSGSAKLEGIPRTFTDLIDSSNSPQTFAGGPHLGRHSAAEQRLRFAMGGPSAVNGLLSGSGTPSAAAGGAAGAAALPSTPTSAALGARQSRRHRSMKKAPESDTERIMQAAKAGRWLEAYRVLKDLEDTGCDVGEHEVRASTQERAKRIGQRFEETQQSFAHSAAGGWTDSWDPELCLDFSFKMSNSTISVVSSKVFEGFDAFQALVALCEFDLFAKHCNVNAADPLRTRPNDDLWRVRKTSRQGEEDNIMHVSWLDALDEENPALWFSVYTPDSADSQELCGVQVPPPDTGAMRVGLWRCCYLISPVWGGSLRKKKAASSSGALLPAFKLTLSLCRRTSMAACLFPEEVMRREVGSIFESLTMLLTEESSLDWRALFSWRAPFYDSVRWHLAAKAPSTAVLAVSPLLRLTFHDISRVLPPGWADSVEDLADSHQDKTQAPSLDDCSEEAFRAFSTDFSS
eukprot:TRINITY_DN40940_c0_g2_i1.p1 TRINITY_DN40940_c0_g2~~TRINITY_DN40940_c0_g2_i1.p1  ORF type:complete len:747 (+),score=150.27 TRINITY_DN40940_c0_g2_i1:96-2336(+)